MNFNYSRTARYPDYTLGYRSLDLQVTKVFEFANGPNLQLRIDVLNVTNYTNYSDLRSGYPGPPYYFQDGNIWGVPRTVKMGFNFAF